MRKIYYYATDSSLGYVSAEDCDKYRDWAKEQIKQTYPDAIVRVDYSDGDNLVCGFDSEENPNGDAEVMEFLSGLWDMCPWSWVKISESQKPWWYGGWEL